MKELSIKEKAERYDELLIKLQKAKVDNDVCDERYCCVIDDIVPELKESEDERIRQRIIHALHGDVLEMSEIKEAIAWLEKKCENRPAWSEDDEERIKNILSVLDVQVCWDGATGEKKNPYQKEIDWLKSLKSRVQPKQEWSEEVEAAITLLKDIAEEQEKDYCPHNAYESKRIDDWVRSKKWAEKPFKLTSLNVNWRYYYGITSNGVLVGPFLIEELEPIPLTPEILEKNGFVDERSNYAYRTDNYHVCYYCADERLSINKYGAILDVHCFYVHQLQHALSLCGIEKEIVI